MNKPIKPEITIPQSFAENGVKTDFDSDLLADGFDNLRPDVLAGDNLNKFIDDTYKGLNYGMAAADAINLINEGETLTVVDGKLTSGASGGGLEIGDIGIAPLGIDETKGKRRYLNGQLIIQEQYVQFTNKVKSAVALYPSLACTESEWQTTATMTVGGQVGKFVVDDDAGTIRLPKIIMPIQGLTDLSKLGEIVEAGLPTHTHTRGTMDITGDAAAGWSSSDSLNLTGAFYKKSRNVDSGYFAGNKAQTYKESFQASRNWTGSTSTGNYSKALATTNTVQQEQIQYPYFIQVATGAETEDNIINEIELNNPFSLLDYKFSEYELNNISWLRSEGQYNSKAIYPAVYDLLLKIHNGAEIKAGVSIKLSTETFTDYDFVLNTADETFRLPIKVKLASGKAVVGNGMTLGLTNGSDDFSVTNIATYGFVASDNFGSPIGTAYTGTTTGNTSIGVTTDPTKSGIETSDNDLYLYFYVGETVQNANLINAGRIEEKLSNYTTHNMVDGQWVVSKKQLLVNQTLSESQDLHFDISDYLPNDGYNYEIIITGMATTGTGVDDKVYLLCGGGMNLVQMSYIPLCAVTNQVSGKKQQCAGGSTIIVEAGNRVVFVRQGNSGAAANVVAVNLVAYRRIGTNI